jgi:predicted GTPase
VTTLGDFQLVDTPGPDEAGQGDTLMTKVKEILREADAIICVLNGRLLRNKAEHNIQKLINSETH